MMTSALTLAQTSVVSLFAASAMINGFAPLVDVDQEADRMPAIVGAWSFEQGF